MFSRISTIPGKPKLVDEGMRGYQEQVMPVAKKMAGTGSG